MGDAEHPLVLVIDDDSDLRQVCLAMLAGRGYRALGAASVGEGLREARRLALDPSSVQARQLSELEARLREIRGR